MLDGYIKPTWAGRESVYSASAIVTAPVIYTTAAGTGGPLLFNPTTSGVTAYLLAMSVAVTTASTVAGALGITGGPSTAPSSTTAIDSSMCLRFTGTAPSPKCSVFRIGTVSANGVGFLPVFQVGTGALTVMDADENIVHLGGIIEVGLGNFASVAASATLTTGVFQIGLVWMEVPNA